MVLLGCDVGDGVTSAGFVVGVGDNGDDIVLMLTVSKLAYFKICIFW